MNKLKIKKTRGKVFIKLFQILWNILRDVYKTISIRKKLSNQKYEEIRKYALKLVENHEVIAEKDDNINVPIWKQGNLDLYTHVNIYVLLGKY